MSAELDQAYRDRLSSARSAAAAGRPVIGIVGRDVPALLVAAAGAQPFRLGPTGGGSDQAWSLLGRAVDRSAAVVLTAVLSGELDFLSGILLTHDSEASVRLFYALQELHRRGGIALRPHLVDQVHLDRPSTLHYNSAQLSSLWERLEEWTGASITTAGLEQARAEQLGLRAALAELQSARRAGRLAGLTMLRAYAVAAALPPAEAVRLLDGVRTSRTVSDHLPLFLTGSAPLGDDLYRILEDAGSVIAGEDHDWGDPVLSDRLPERIRDDRGGVLEDLALSRLRGAPASASSSMAARALATAEGVRASGARGLISVVRDHDEAPLWDWRHQKEKAGVPSIQLRGDAASDAAALAGAVETLRAAS